MNNTSYDLKSVQLPKLTGRGLKLFAAALERGTARALLGPRLLKDGGITRLREIEISEAPTNHPITYVNKTTSAPPDLNAIAPAAGQGTAVPWATIREYAQAYRQQKTTPEKVAQQILDAVAASDEGALPMRAFIANDRQDMMAQARAATERIQAGNPLSILDGVPIAVKDEVDQVPYPTTVGTAFMGRAPAMADSTVVARLRAAGALLIGKTNMHEIGINPNGFNAHYGAARNPYHLGHDTGGSSSGSAAAVAAGFCPVAIGADGGGSIRIPAAFCGVVGLKATYGRISEHGAAPLCWSVAHLGPIGASVEDVALTYAAIAGTDGNDAMTQHQPTPTVDGWNQADLSGLTLGLFRPWFNHATADIVATCEMALDQLTQAGAKIEEIEIPELDMMRIAHAVTILAEMATSMDNMKVDQRQFGAPVRVNLTIGRMVTAQDYVQAQRVRTRAMAIFADLFKRVDAIITPATAVTAPPIPVGGIPDGWSDLSTETEVMRYIVPANLTGLPGISFPVGYDGDGLPIGLHAMGRPWQEHVLLQIAYAAEQVVERKRPSQFYDILGKG